MSSLNYFLLIILLLGAGQSDYAQRCGGSIDYIPRDEKGELINVGKIKVNYVRRVLTSEYEPYMYFEGDAPSIKKGHYQVNTLYIHTGCGMKLVEVDHRV